MKNRLYALVIATVMLLVPLVAFGSDLSTLISPYGDLSTEEVPTSEQLDNTVIQFFDPNFEAATRAVISKPIGDITASDVARVVTLRINDLYIVDLKGIEYFTALEKLDCGQNQLKTLDVSHNPALIVLSCEYNQLTTLDVSYNPALKELDCSENFFPDESAITGLGEKKLDNFVFDPQGDE